jgi:hypothetical protein
LVLALLGKRGHGGFVWDSRPGFTILLLGPHSKGLNDQLVEGSGHRDID